MTLLERSDPRPQLHSFSDERARPEFARQRSAIVLSDGRGLAQGSASRHKLIATCIGMSYPQVSLTTREMPIGERFVGVSDCGWLWLVYERFYMLLA